MWKYPVNLVGGIILTQRWGKGSLTRKGWGWSLRTVFLVLKLRCFLVLWGGQKNIILCWAYISLTFILNQNSAPCGPLAAFPSRPHCRHSQAVRSRSLFQMLSSDVCGFPACPGEQLWTGHLGYPSSSTHLPIAQSFHPRLVHAPALHQGGTLSSSVSRSPCTHLPVNAGSLPSEAGPTFSNPDLGDQTLKSSCH